MKKDIVFAGFTINVKNFYNEKKLQNPSQPVRFFVADIVGSGAWPYPFDTIYWAYYNAAKSNYVNWNTARGVVGKIFKEAIPTIETTLGVKIHSFQANRKGHPVACYEIL